MNRHPLSRRRFACAAASLAVPVARARAGEAPKMHTVTFPDGTTVPAIGQGSWHLGQGRHPRAAEEEALRTGIALGMTVIDTAENYGDGASEQFIGRAVEGWRDKVFLVTKVEPENTAGDGIARACRASLGRLRTDYLDLYLLHAPVAVSSFRGVVAKFEELRESGKIRRWGVSNFDVRQMEALFRVPGGDRCATNQVGYNLRNSAIEKDLLPWCTARKVPVMAYSPLATGNSAVVRDPDLAKIGAGRGASAAAIALAWVVRGGNVIAIPESGSPEHVKENAAALTIW